MPCHVCGEEAVGRCYNCGALFCAKHGDENCYRCESSFMAGDPRQDRITVLPGQASQRGGWWRPKPAEGYTPPACYACGGIAHRVCHHCQQVYCPEHAGKNGMCAECNRSSLLGLVIFIGAGLILAGLIIGGWLQSG
jgi:hypothetical protein